MQVSNQENLSQNQKVSDSSQTQNLCNLSDHKISDQQKTPKKTLWGWLCSLISSIFPKISLLDRKTDVNASPHTLVPEKKQSSSQIKQQQAANLAYAINKIKNKDQEFLKSEAGKNLMELRRRQNCYEGVVENKKSVTNDYCRAIVKSTTMYKEINQELLSREFGLNISVIPHLTNSQNLQQTIITYQLDNIERQQQKDPVQSLKDQLKFMDDLTKTVTELAENSNSMPKLDQHTDKLPIEDPEQIQIKAKNLLPFLNKRKGIINNKLTEINKKFTQKQEKLETQVAEKIVKIIQKDKKDRLQKKLRK